MGPCALKNIHKPLCILCYIGALGWFAMLGHKDLNNEIYFSENVLDLVTYDFNGEHAATQFYNDFMQELQDKYKYNDEMPTPWLESKMSQLNLEVYTHNFTLNDPMRHGQTWKGTNVYGILRAASTPSLEAVMVSAPFRSHGSHQEGTAAGIALMLAFAQFAKPQKYWTKDIIFLVTEHEHLGMQAWLEAYHGLQSNIETFYPSLNGFWKGVGMDFERVFEKIGLGNQKCLDFGTLTGRSGPIQAAINLEIHDPRIKYIEVKIEDQNSQLSKFDLVKLVHKLCVKSGIYHSYQNSFEWTRNKMEEWGNNLWIILGMVSNHIAAVPNGNHDLFHRFSIEAITLEGRYVTNPAGSPPRARSRSQMNFYRLGAALENILRTFNNLLERFHQSYFFHMLAAINRFISLSQYMPCICLPCLAMMIRALSLWVSIQEDPKEINKPEVVNQTEREANTSDSNPREQGDHEPGEVEQSNEEMSLRHRRAKLKQEAPVSILHIGGNYFAMHFIGCGVMNSPTLLSYIGAVFFEVPSEVAVFFGLIAMSICFAIIAPLLLRMRLGRISRKELVLVNILVLIELSTVCLSAGVNNISLGLAVAALYTPVALVVDIIIKKNTWKSTLSTFLRRTFCLLFHPLLVVLVGMFVYAGVLSPEEELPERAGRALVFGNRVFDMATATLLPIWLIFWQIVCNRVDG